MNSKIAIFISLTLLACGCGNHHPSSEFRGAAVALQTARDYWLNHGSPTDFQPGEVVGPSNQFFVYTNTVRTTNAVLHCRFGSRGYGWPPGILAITDEGLVIWIAKDGKVTISPEKNGVDP
jgi:hypothetical protein